MQLNYSLGSCWDETPEGASIAAAAISKLQVFINVDCRDSSKLLLIEAQDACYWIDVDNAKTRWDSRNH